MTIDAAEASARAHLDRLGVDYEVMDCDPSLADTAAFCEAYGVAPADSANTIIVAGKGRSSADAPPTYVACVVLATTRLDVNGLVRKRLGTRKASFASAEETNELTGMLIGGVTAFELPDGLPLWVDAAVMDRESIVLGGGSRSCKIRCAPAALLEVDGAEVVDDLARPLPAEPG